MSIIIPNGGHVINDATATEAMVKSGKVFYNNTGKHTGTATVDESKVYTVNVTKYEDNMISYNRNTVNFYYPDSSLGVLTQFDVTSYESVGGFYANISLPVFKRLTGIKYQGKRYNISQSSVMMICSSKPTYSGSLPTPWMLLSPGNITGSNRSINIFETGTFTFYYI